MGGNPQRHIRSGPIAHPWAYCCQHDSHSHASLCFPQRRPEARVASALNELGRIAQQQGKLDDAEADFHRMADITGRFTPASTITSGSQNQIWRTSM